MMTALSRAKWDAFEDRRDLTMFADNLVPHVLRLNDVLVFSDELLTRIEAVEDIPVGSSAELEIRACGVHAVELLAAEVRKTRRPDLTSGSLDNVLWNLGADALYKAVPRHRSKCVFY